MARFPLRACSGLCLAALVGLAPAVRAANDKTEGVCSTFGTKVEFVSTPSEAARLAKKEQKLVFVLHVSGKFEDPRFT
jgi:hypothetical protein